MEWVGGEWHERFSTVLLYKLFIRRGGGVKEGAREMGINKGCGTRWAYNQWKRRGGRGGEMHEFTQYYSCRFEVCPFPVVTFSARSSGKKGDRDRKSKINISIYSSPPAKVTNEEYFLKFCLARGCRMQTTIWKRERDACDHHTANSFLRSVAWCADSLTSRRSDRPPEYPHRLQLGVILPAWRLSIRPGPGERMRSQKKLKDRDCVRSKTNKQWAEWFVSFLACQMRWRKDEILATKVKRRILVFTDDQNGARKEKKIWWRQCCHLFWCWAKKCFDMDAK